MDWESFGHWVTPIVILGILIGVLWWAVEELLEIGEARQLCIEEGYADRAWLLNQDYCVGYYAGIPVLVPLATVRERLEEGYE